jgi:glucokinase
MMSEVIIGLDLGGTRVRAARLSHDLEILERHETLTDDERGLEATLTTIKDLIHEVLPKDGTSVAGIGVSAPGPLNPVTGVVVAPPNLKGWHNVPLADILHQEFSIPVYVGNDANVAGLAETVRGAAMGFRHVIFTTLSTGIGTGMICDGKMLLGKEGLAAEGGHIIMVVDGEPRDFEKETAGPALALKVRARIEKGEKSIVTDMVAGKLDDISGATVGQAAQQGDALALDVVRAAGKMLGLGMVNFLHLFNPEILVFGGSVSKLGNLLFDPMRDAIQRYCMDEAYWRDLRIEQAALGENVSVIGAASLVVTRGGVVDVAEAIARMTPQ